MWNQEINRNSKTKLKLIQRITKTRRRKVKLLFLPTWTLDRSRVVSIR